MALAVLTIRSALVVAFVVSIFISVLSVLLIRGGLVMIPVSVVAAAPAVVFVISAAGHQYEHRGQGEY